MWPLLLPLVPIGIPFSTGNTDEIFHTSFSALAFSVAAPRRATK